MFDNEAFKEKVGPSLEVFLMMEMRGDRRTCEESVLAQHEITHTHNRGPYILLLFLCVSEKSRHMQFTDSIPRRSSMVGRLPVSKLNFIRRGRRV